MLSSYDVSKIDKTYLSNLKLESYAFTYQVIDRMLYESFGHEKEKYMNSKQKAYFKKRLVDWRKEIVDTNTKNLYLKDIDNEISSPDIVDQASTHTEKKVEMRT